MDFTLARFLRYIIILFFIAVIGWLLYSLSEIITLLINASLIAEGVKRHGHRDVHYLSDREEISAYIMKIVRPGDMILTLGAGDIWKVNQKIAVLLKERFL